MGYIKEGEKNKSPALKRLGHVKTEKLDMNVLRYYTMAQDQGTKDISCC
jgi:hypothetical protein